MLNQMPYPSTGQPPVPQYGYVAPYQWDNTYGIPTFSNIFYLDAPGRLVIGSCRLVIGSYWSLTSARG